MTVIVADGEDTSGPSEPVSIKELDGSDRAPQTKVSVEDFDLLKVSCFYMEKRKQTNINRFWAKGVLVKS